MMVFNSLCLLVGVSLLTSGVFPLPSQSQPSLQSPRLELTLPTRLRDNLNLSASANFTTPFFKVPNHASQVHCDGEQYRKDLIAVSCLDALSQIPQDSSNVRFSMRGGGLYDVALPSRWISCECYY